MKKIITIENILAVTACMNWCTLCIAIAALIQLLL